MCFGGSPRLEGGGCSIVRQDSPFGVAPKILCLIASSYYSFILLASCFVVVPILTGPIGLVYCRVWWELLARHYLRTLVKSGK